jgi:adenylosuccinate lyase
MNPLQAVSPIDGRYSNQTSSLSSYFSEYGLIYYRVKVEIEYFIALCELPLPQLSDFDKSHYDELRNLYQNFSETDAVKIKETEKVTNHDVKAVEYFIKEAFDDLGLERYKEFIHFGLTSQDVNNTSIPLSLKDGMSDIVLTLIEETKRAIQNLSLQWAGIPMLAKTHGQPASPTLLGKEMAVFNARLVPQLNSLYDVVYAAKFGGATGNMNAHYVAYPTIDWDMFASNFVNDTLNLQRSYPTTQIEHYDHLATLFDNLKRINTILIDFSRDVWQYISMGYFKQKIKAGEIGSSAMPHKVNPIDFENAEGNLGMANAILEHLSAKLPISRLQRDLTDSTVLRNIGVPLGHMVIAYNSLLRGISKLELNQAAINADLEDNWAVVAEGIQNILRREGFPKPYEALKELTRKNEKVTEASISKFIDGLDVSDKIRMELKEITPFNYVGKY